ncbi:MAG: DUF2341 domain-containing protein [Thermoplasmata archaeon]|nr:MAG: DUF2341 domain-containing protein [Thermoplasmata archaeon]
MDRHELDKGSVSKVLAIGMVLILLLSSVLVLFLILNDTPSSEAETTSNPIGTITGAIDDRYFGWNVSSAGDINDDGYDDVIVGAPYSGVVIEASGWWNDNWSYRKRLSFDNSGQNENLTNFPVMVNLNPANFDYAKTNLDASDLRFIDADGVTELAYHVEEWNSLGDSYIWVNVTQIDGNSNSDYIWMYYNNSAAPGVQDVGGTYDSDYVGVWHLNDSVGPVSDSTTNGHDGTALGGVDRGFTGMVDGAYDFQGDDDYMDFGNDPQLMITGDITLEAWVNIDTDPVTYDYAIMQFGDSGETEAENWLYLLVLTPGATGLDVDIGHEYGDGIDEMRTYGANLQLDTWYYLVATRDVSVNEWRLYIDGTQFDTPFVYVNGPSGGSLGNLMVCMDWFNAAWRFTDGTMDELRISSSPRSADWISAQCLTMKDNFITFGYEEKKNGTCGAAYIFFGGPGIMGSITAGDADIIINGSALNDRFGCSVAAGNVVGDNTTDILVGAPGYNGGQNLGAVYIFDGDTLKADADGQLVASEATNIITGEDFGDEFGSAVSGAGDVDNDGNDDVIVGAPEYGVSKGRAYIFFGDGSIPATASDADVFLPGFADNSRFGHSVSSTGDMNVDGNCDVIVGAPGENKAYIYFGGADMTSNRLSKPMTKGPLDNTNNNIDDLKLDDDSYYTVPKNGKTMFIDSFDTTGLVGRVTNAALLVQYYTQNNYDTNDNITWALDGQPLQDTDIEITQSALEVTPPGYDLFAQGVDTLEELGTLDICLINTATGGQVNVFFDYVWIEVTTNAATPMVILNGSGDFGWSVSNGGDVNGDDVGDVIIGAPDLTGGTPGKVYVKYGDFQGFEEEVTGSIPFGWVQLVPATNPAVVSENSSYGSSTKSVEFNWTGGDLAEVKKVFPPASQVEVGTVEFSVSVSEVDLGPKFYCIIGNNTTANEITRVSFGTSVVGQEDFLRYFEGNGDGTGQYTNVQRYTADTWYHFRIVFDLTANRFDIYIDGELKVEGGRFTWDNTIPDFISFHQFNVGNNHIDYVDNVAWLTAGPEVSMTGAVPRDFFGYSVSDAGDIGGDGLDDIVVGAPNAQTNGSAYVFYGNALLPPVLLSSNANYTLVGEEAEDNFGASVSCAGDVDNDNQDDIIIGAPYYDDGTNINAGKAYIFFGPNVTYRPDLWINGSLDNVYQAVPSGAQINLTFISAGENAIWWILLQNDGNENDTFDFGIAANILAGWTWVLFDNGTKNMVNDGDSVYLAPGEMRNYTLNISSSAAAAPLDESSVEIGVLSQNGSTNDSVKAIARILPDLSPEITDVLEFPDPQETGGSVNITCNVTDDFGVSSVWVNITLPGGGYSNVTMGKGIGNQWFYKNAYVPLGLYQYTIWANDTSGNWNSSSGYGFTIQDTTLPKITMVLDVPDPQETGGYVNISCDITDNVMVGNVWVNISLPGGGYDNVSMVRGAGDQWFHNNTFAILGLHQYAIWANDTSNNWNTSSGYNFTIQDSTLPVITNVLDVPDPQEVNNWVNISCDVIDNTGVDTVWVNLTLPGGGYNNVTMAPGAVDRWFYNSSFAILGLYQYTIWVNDTTDNWNSSSGHSFTMQDTTFPVISNVLNIPDPQETGGYANISCDVSDDNGVFYVGVNLTLPGGGSMNLSMNKGADDQWFLNNTYTTMGLYQFTIWANDSTGNWNSSSGHGFTIQDTTLPEISNVSAKPDVQFIDGYVNISCDITDAVGVYGAWVNVTLPGGGNENLTLIQGSGGHWYINKTYTIIGVYQYTIWVNDTAGNWNKSSTFGFEVPNRGPSLSSGQVDPAAGYNDTWFNFTVTYTDLDNHLPDKITVNITNVGIFDMVEFDPLDIEYTDGKGYYLNVTGFQNGTPYSFHFAANDTIGNWTETAEIPGPQVLNTPPALLSPGVNPLSGMNTTYFNFTASYYDIDNDPPTNFTLNLTGPSGGTFDLLEVDPSDTDYSDGKEYYYNTTLSNGAYSFHFAASDSPGLWYETSEINAPMVGISNPILTNSEVVPISGYTDTWFNFTVDYSHPFNKGPDRTTLNLTGPSGGTFDLTEVDPSDLDYTDGKLFYYNVTGLAVGSYTFHFAANDTDGNWSESSVLGFDVVNRIPSLSAPQVNPTAGYIDTGFNFTVIYTDLDNHAPDTITVNITGLGIYGLIEADPLDINFADGKSYYINISGMPIGTAYTFHFAAKDSMGDWVESLEIEAPDVLNRGPTLSLIQVTPTIGYIDTWFNFTVTYADLDGHSPGTITVNITGVGIYPLAEIDPLDMDYTDGKEYFYNVSGFTVGVHDFHFAANDTVGGWTETGVLQFDVLNRGPTLSLDQVMPTIGYIDTWFNFTVTYTDLDGNAPGKTTVNITNRGTFYMVEVDSSDTDYTDGKEYYLNISGFQTGISYSFHFAANDTFGDWTESVEVMGPLVLNTPSFLISPGVDPISGTSSTYFNFTVTYMDADNQPPEKLTLNLTGPSGGSFDLMEVDPSDIDCSDGKLYYHNISGLTPGSYSFYFAANDSDGIWYESGTLGLGVINRIPLLSSPQVNPATGYVETGFNFTVTYTDLDNHAPDKISVNITGWGTFDLYEVDSFDTDYGDGKAYYRSVSGFGIGPYSFHFAANDTIGAWTDSGILLFDVINRAPGLSGDGVDPVSGYSDTEFNFTVTYTDLDNHAPDKITVNITNLGIFDPTEIDPSDTDYMDGKSYYVILSGIPTGTSYTFHFAASDTLGRWAPETPEIDAPDVHERNATLTSYDKEVKYSDNVLLNATLMQDGAPIAGEDVEYYIDVNDNAIFEPGELVGVSQTIADGSVSLAYPAMLVPGVYSYITVYPGVLYNVPNSTATLVVEPKPAAITAYDNIIEEGQSVILNATLEDEDGNSLPNQSIEFHVDRNKNSVYEGGELVGYGETDGNGYIETIHLPQLRTGTYPIRVNYIGSVNYSVTEGYAFLIIQNTTNNPPVIVTEVPDQIKLEDSPPWVLLLTPYESDIEDAGENLSWYLTGVNTSLYTVTGMNSTGDAFTFVPVENAFGNDEVTLWLVDSSGATTSQNLWVNLTPDNDRPKIESINPLTVHFDDDYTYFLYNYVSDIETPKEDLVLTTDDSEHTTVDGLTITFRYPESMLGETVNVLVTVTDAHGGSTSTIVIVKVSDDWVPELEKELPDVTLYEGETIVNAFDLDDYFSDPDGDALFYVTGQSYVTIDIDMETNVVNVTAPTNWYGSETVAFHALDPSKARVEDIVLITVLPINDVPSISDVPDLVVRFDQDCIFDLRPYISDEDNSDSELILSVIDPVTGLPIQGVDVDPNNNLGLLINLPESMNGSIVQLEIWVSDGLDSNFTTINITVSDDYPPELIIPLPDVSFEEDAELKNAFNISNFFVDIDDDYLIYTSGHDSINVTINPDGTVDFSAPVDWFGSEHVTFRAEDDSGALVEDTITVSVIPVNDAPTIAQIPEQFGEQGKIWVIDISELLFDIDNDIEDLILIVDSEYVSVVGHTLIFDYPMSVEGDTVTVTVSDGDLNSSVTLSVTVAKLETPSTGPLLLDYIFWILLIPIILAALFLGFTAYKRKVNAPYVEEVFLIADDGTLIAHNSLSLEEEIDRDILSGMLTGVKNLISDAFARGEGREKGLHKLEFGEKNILLEKGDHFFIALVFSGEENRPLLSTIKKVIKELEEKYGSVFEEWQGDMEVFVDTDDILEPLLSLDKLTKEEREQLKDARKRLKEAKELAIRELDIQLVDLLSQGHSEGLEDLPPPPEDWED